jgi:hypothetical protein
MMWPERARRSKPVAKTATVTGGPRIRLLIVVLATHPQQLAEERQLLQRGGRAGAVGTAQHEGDAPLRAQAFRHRL